MDTQSTLKTEKKSLGDKSYGHFTLREIIEFYLSNAVDLAGSNGDAPIYSEYSHNLSKRVSDRFNLGNHRLGYLLAPLLSYGNCDGSRTVRGSPIEYRAVKIENSRACLTRVFLTSVDNMVENAINEIGPELDKRLTEALLTERPNPIQHSRIEPFDSWVARVMNNNHKH